MAERNKAPQRLKAYRAKRDFAKTPEPSGDTRTKGGAKAGSQAQAERGGAKRFFCVQKHLASHLHYDFRLEHDGVLLSWAVPKGPSLDPADKRLAMQVEDHPFDYGEFEGVIPEGYGKGIVLLWDRGTWAPEPGFEDVDKALAKGELKLRLDGVKLKGGWVIVRTGGRGAGRRGGGAADGRSWLLIKHRDEWAGPVDVVGKFPLSVKSFGDFEDVLAQENPRVWESHRPARGGEAGALLATVIERAATLKGAAAPSAKASPAKRPGGKTRGTSPGAKAKRTEPRPAPRRSPA